MCITLIRVPASAKAEQHCYRACYAACVALVANSRSETRHMLSASEKTLQRARSETVNSLAVGSFCFMNPWGGTLCPFCCNGAKVVVLRYVTLRDQRVPHKKQKTFSPNSACTYPFLLRLNSNSPGNQDCWWSA